MTKLAQSVLDLIGNTPIVKLNRVANPEDAEVYVKLRILQPR